VSEVDDTTWWQTSITYVASINIENKTIKNYEVFAFAKVTHRTRTYTLKVLRLASNGTVSPIQVDPITPSQHFSQTLTSI